MPLRVARPAASQRVRGDLGAGVEARLEVAKVHGLGVRPERLERHRLLHVRAAQLAHPHVDRVSGRPRSARGSWRPIASPRPSGRGRTVLPMPEPSPRPTRLRGRAAAGGRLQRVQADPARSWRRRSRPLLDRRRDGATAWTMPAHLRRVLCSTVWPMRRRPSERSVSSWRWFEPLRDRRWVITSVAHAFAGSASASAAASAAGLARRRSAASLGGAVASAACSAQAEHRVDRQAAQLGDLLGRAQRLQPGDRRLDEVDRVLRAEDLTGCRGSRRARAPRARRRRRSRRYRRGRLEQHAARTPKMPSVWCVIVEPCFGTRKRFFFAARRPSGSRAGPRWPCRSRRRRCRPRRRRRRAP